MKLIRFLIPLIILIISCSHVDALNRDFKARRIRFCKNKEMKHLDRKAGWGCYRYCVLWSRFRRNTTPNCKKWKTDYYDLQNSVIFKQFRDANFVMIQENRID